MNIKSKYTCQICKKTINNSKEGWVQWQENDKLQYYGFKVIHHKIYSPNRFIRDNGCYPYINDSKLNDLPLSYFSGIDGMEFLIQMATRKTFDGNPQFVYRNEIDQLFIRLLNIPNFLALS